MPYVPPQRVVSGGLALVDWSSVARGARMRPHAVAGAFGRIQAGTPSEPIQRCLPEDRDVANARGTIAF